MQNQWHVPFGADEMVPKQTRINTQQSKLSHQETGNSQQILQLNVASFLGLNKILLDKIVFKRKQQKYYMRKWYHQNAIISDQIYHSPKDFTIQAQILQNNKHSIPVCRLKPNHPQQDSVIIYAHGNASDLVDSLQYVEKLAEQLKIQIVAFDYTGYGCSKIGEITEQSLRKDLEIVIAWVAQSTPLDKIILWGFSLGTYPVCYCSSKYKLRGTILQSPLASIGCLFKQNQIDPQTHILNDHIVNLNYIHKVKSPLLIMHSKIDKIVPFSHAVVLVKKYIKYNNPENILFLEVGNLQHNQMHQYFINQNTNMLKKELIKFINKLQSPNMSMSSCMENIYAQISNRFLTNPSSSSILCSPKSSKLKIVSETIYPNSGKKQKKSQISKIRSTFNLAKIPEYNSQQEQLQIQNGIITRKFSNKNSKCFCLQKC